LGSSATQRLYMLLGLSAVCASASPVLEGTVSSATTFHTLPSPLPVLSAFQPVGTLPMSSLLRRIFCSFSSPHWRDMFSNPAKTAALNHRIRGLLPEKNE